MPLDTEQARAIAQEAVRETLMLLGIDAHAPKDVQSDFLFLREQRLAAERFRDNLRRTGWALLVAAICGFAGWAMTALHLPKGP